jgi:hypothetical protein
VSNRTDNALFSADNIVNSTDNILFSTNNLLSSTDKSLKDTPINTDISLNIESLLHDIYKDTDVKISNVITTKNDDYNINNIHNRNYDNNNISNNDDNGNNDTNNDNGTDSNNILQTGELLDGLSRGESESTLFGSIGQLCTHVIRLYLCIFLYTHMNICLHLYTHLFLLNALTTYIHNIKIKRVIYIEYFYHNEYVIYHY